MLDLRCVNEIFVCKNNVFKSIKFNWILISTIANY